MTSASSNVSIERVAVVVATEPRANIDDEMSSAPTIIIVK